VKALLSSKKEAGLAPLLEVKNQELCDELIKKSKEHSLLLCNVN